MVQLLTLPFRMVFGLLLGIVLLPFALLALPFLLLRFLFKALLALVMLPFALIAASIGIVFAAIGIVLAVVIPLAPLVLMGLGVWALVQMVKPRSPAAIATRD